METFGTWLKARREAVSKTQGEIANLVGCTKAYISALERDIQSDAKSPRKIRPSLEFLENLAKALRVPNAEILAKAGYPIERQSSIPDETELLRYFREMSPNRREDILRIVKALYKDYQEHGTSEPDSSDY